ncbi:MAG: glycosyltransferase [Flavobacterium sp.]|nr:glycosyltransferase [Flavobacterium sp.]
MDKKKILVVSHSFYPDNSPRAFRTTELVKELCRQGHDVTLLSHWKTEMQDLIYDYGFHFLPLKEVTWKQPKIFSMGPFVKLSRIFIRFSKLFFEYPNIQLLWNVSKALKNEKGYDQLISIAVPYPVHWGVAMRWKKNSDLNPAKVWIADCGDPYMGGENDTFRPPFYFAWVEKWFCKKVTYLTVPTEGSIQGYYPEFHSKIRVIPQGFKFDEILLYTGDKDSNKPQFAYAGLFIKDRRDPSQLLQYLVSLPNDFVFHIYTKSPQLVHPFVAKSGGRIILHEPIPRKDLLFELSKMDFVVNFENVGTIQTPSKLIDYAILKKPILSVTTDKLNSTIVDEFLNANYTHQVSVKNPDQYRIENVVQKFISLA